MECFFTKKKMIFYYYFFKHYIIILAISFFFLNNFAIFGAQFSHIWSAQNVHSINNCGQNNITVYLGSQYKVSGQTIDIYQ